mmetsp:Transcript_107181/g.279876  ORF Transcript_107181/g.279876 Transcript_107181/m.279876 type:complete len:118 (+) Transcript_107181:797-1150(+)
MTTACGRSAKSCGPTREKKKTMEKMRARKKKSPKEMEKEKKKKKEKEKKQAKQKKTKKKARTRKRKRRPQAPDPQLLHGAWQGRSERHEDAWREVNMFYVLRTMKMVAATKWFPSSS